jgi:hypothetical protein
MPPTEPPPPSSPLSAEGPASEPSATDVTIAEASHAAGSRELAALVDRIAVLSVALARAVEVGDEHAMTVLHEQVARIERFLRSVGQK